MWVVLQTGKANYVTLGKYLVVLHMVGGDLRRVKQMTVYRCQKCGSNNVEIGRDDKGYNIKCWDCGHYVNVGNEKDAENALKSLRRNIKKLNQLKQQWEGNITDDGRE